MRERKPSTGSASIGGDAFAAVCRATRENVSRGHSSPFRPIVALVLVTASGVSYALSGIIEQGGIGFFSGTGASAGDTKFYCDWRFDPIISPTIPACAQLDPELVALQVPPDFQLGVEADPTPIEFSQYRTVTNWTVPETAPPVRTSLICETGGDTPGKEYCLKITQGAPGVFSGPSSCPQKFASITASPSECADDLALLNTTYATTGAHIDWTSDRNDVAANQIHINICTASTWSCVNMTTSEYLAGIQASEIQQLGSTMVQTPIQCLISGVKYTFKTRKTCP